MQAVAAVQAGNDVHTHKLVSALRVIFLGVRLRIPDHAQALKLDALYKFGPFSLEVGDEANASHLGCAMLQPAPEVERVVEYKRAHSVALADQGLSQVRAKEAISAGD